MKIAIYYGNRGFFPGEVIASAREEMRQAVEKAGFEAMELGAEETRYGAVETIAEGKRYAAFLEERRGEYDGVIVCLPNFGDENGAYYALKDAGVPILVQAYPDEIGKMDFAHRRDAVCGKIAMCNVFRQAGIGYTLTREFAVHPLSEAFGEDLRVFGGICRTVKGLKHFTVGAIGARTTAFKTVRADEIAFQRKRINVETIDLTQVFALMEKAEESRLSEKKAHLREVSDFGKYGEEKLENLARLGIALDELIEEVGKEAARFFFIMRSPDSALDFDLDLAKAESSDNPVYYVQYAHARICSILSVAGVETPKAADVDLSLLTEENERVLIRKLAEWPQEVADAARELAPYHLAYYAKELANAFHSFYNSCKVLTDDAALRDARLALVDCTRITLRNVLTLLGLSAPERM